MTPDKGSLPMPRNSAFPQIYFEPRRWVSESRNEGIMTATQKSVWGVLASTLIVAGMATIPISVPAQSVGADLPFGPGEDLRYSLSLGRFGGSGEGAMKIEGVERIRGRDAYRLTFNLNGRVAGMARIEDRTRSWLDPHAMAAVRYEKTERSPLSSNREEVEIFPDEKRWLGADGSAGDAASARPLDELSFLYFIRTLPLRNGETHTVARHFDKDRNPVRIRVIGRERIRVPAGEYATVVVEMRVQDVRRFEGAGVIRLYLSDDRARIPVRIQTAMPVVGITVLELTSARSGHSAPSIAARVGS